MNEVKSSLIILNYANARFANNVIDRICNVKSSVYLMSNSNLDRKVNAKSLLGILSLSLKPLETLIVFVYNEDLKEAEQDLKTVMEAIDTINVI